MVAASKLRRAQERIQQARPFATADAARAEQPGGARRSVVAPAARRAHGAARGRPALLFVITADRGLCGSFNTNVIKAAARSSPSIPAGRSRSGWSAAAAATTSRGAASRSRYEQINLFAQLKFDDAQEIAQTAIEAFIARRGRQRVPGLQRVQVGDGAARRRRAAAADPAERRSRPRPDAGSRRRRSTISTSRRRRSCSSTLLPRHVEVQVFRALLESNAAFYAAQMTAMDAATRNSGEMIESLTLYMNKVRQAAITQGDHRGRLRRGAL